MEENLAVAFIESHGDEVELARLEHLLGGGRPSEEIIARLLFGQRPDGGWAPLWAPEASSLDATCYRIAQAEQLGLDGKEPAISRAVAFLLEGQRSDGSWEEDGSLKPFAPPWAAPGNPAARLYLTANCGFWLAVLAESTPTLNLMTAARNASSYLELYLDESGKLPGFLHAGWLAAGLWARLGQAEIAARVTNYLGERLPDLASSSLAWLVLTLAIAGVPGYHPLIAQAVRILEGSQTPDGRWQSEDGPERDVHTTLEALRAIRICGSSPPRSSTIGTATG
jgi:hypothetical protein